MQDQQIDQDQQFIESLRQQILHFQQETLPKINQSTMNVFFVGKSGGGKSTLLNGICDRKIIFQKDEGCCFIPDQQQSQMYFEIADDQSESKTKDPKVIQLNDSYQIWDLPGYQDSRSAEEDLKNLIIKKLIIDNSNQTQIVIVLQECQLTGDKGCFLLDILNILSEDNIIPTLVISFANEDLELEFIQEQLQKYISNDQTILTQKGKILLQKVVDQNRVQLFNEPILIDNQTDYYELSQENLKQLKSFIFQPQFFQKVSMKFQLLDDAKQKLKQICLKLKNDLQRFENQIFTELLQIWELKITDYSKQNTWKILQLENQNQRLAILYSNQLNNIKILGQFIEEFNELEDEALKIRQQVEKIVIQEQIIQQVTTLRIFCGQMNITRLKEILKGYINIDTIYIYSLFSFQVDDNFEFSGLTFCIKTKNFIVASQTMMTINLSGKNGNILTEKKAQQNLNGKNGVNGLNGNNGQNGGNFILDSQEYGNMDNLIINLSGGNGSDGQDGGDGQDGENGSDAQQKSVNMKQNDCERHEEVIDYDGIDYFTLNKEKHIELTSRGTIGSQGGNAGKGGKGGLNGLKGLFNIKNNQGACKIIENDGIQGKEGFNGKIGKGGINGKDYTRKLYDIQYEGLGLDKLVENQFNQQIVEGKEYQFKGKRFWFTIVNFGIIQNIGSAAQIKWKDGKWMTEGQFIDKGRAQDGLINSEFENQQEIRIESNYKEQLENFQVFIQNQQNEHKGKIYNDLL
ncbi:hypothetical protein pb186bvf_001730 [Paramecium bursaria]